MKRPITLLCFLLIFHLGSSQNVDSLLTLNTVDSLLTTALKQIQANKYQDALPLLLQAADLSKQKWGENNARYATALHRLAFTYVNMGQSDKSEHLYLKAIGIRKSVLGTAHLDYAQSLNNLGVLYTDRADYSKAEPLYLECKNIKEKALGKDHPQYANSLNNLGLLYSYQGEYAKAEPLFLEAIDIWEKTEVISPDYGFPVGNLAGVYHAIGNNGKAEILYIKAKEIQAKICGKEHPDYAVQLLNLAVVVMEKGDYSNAESMYLEAMKIFANKLGKDHPKYARSLNALAYLYRLKGDYAKAEPLLLEAKAIQTKALGKEHPEYARSLETLAILYYFKAEYDKAESLFLEANEIWLKVSGEEHMNYAESLNNLAKLYIATSRIPEASNFFIASNVLTRRLIEKSAAYSSEDQMVAYLHTFGDKLAEFQSFSLSYSSPELCRANFDNQLFLNGFLLENARQLSLLASNTDSLTQDIYHRWQSCHRRLAVEYMKPLSDRRLVTELEAEAQGYEKTLTRNLPMFIEARRVLHWKEVRDHQPPGSAVIEFTHFRYLNPQPTDSICYAALLLLPGEPAPRMIPLFEQHQLEALLPSVDARRADLNMLYQNPALYQLLWASLEKYLSGVQTVYFSPSGWLHRLNLGAITTPDSKTIGDHYQLVQVGSTRQLVIPTQVKPAANNAILYGGIQYDMDSTSMVQANQSWYASRSDDTRGDAAAFPEDTTLRGQGWRYLLGAEREVTALQPVLHAAGLQTELRMDYAASEESFKHIGQEQPSPRILHIATHGFFFPDPKDTNKKTASVSFSNEERVVFRRSDNPMLRSGLVLAGANRAWQGYSPLNGLEDGILTAYEISQVNLSHTELVVLSACETGLGDIQGNEGVYGLQRAFKIAGVKYLIMSLWQVPDKQTSELMQVFYQKWLQDKLEIPQAFHAAQQEMQAKYPGDPFVWAGFVLVE